MNVRNQTFLLTGATGGLGQAIAKALSAAGVHLILTGRNENALKQLSDSLSGIHQIVVADITTTQGRDAIIGACRQRIRLDGVIHCAGNNHFGWFETAQPEDISRLVDVNLTSSILFIHQLLPVLKRQTRSQVVVIGSILGSIGLPGYSLYSATKFGLRGFCESLRRELYGTAIRVRYFAPRAINTSMNSDAVVALNQSLNNTVDEPEVVAQQVLTFLTKTKTEHFHGWPEKLFVKINGLLSKLVDNSIKKQFTTYRKYLSNEES